MNAPIEAIGPIEHIHTRVFHKECHKAVVQGHPAEARHFLHPHFLEEGGPEHVLELPLADRSFILNHAGEKGELGSTLIT